MTAKRMNEILKELTVIIDTREQDLHVAEYFQKNGINYIHRALKFGDYSFISPAIPEFGINEPFSFENRIVFERKGDLTELSGNLSQGRERFENELQRAKDAGAKLILLTEDGSYEQILRHNYRTDLNERSYIASLFAFQARYGIEVQFVPRKQVGWYIYNTFKYVLREELKGFDNV